MKKVLIVFLPLLICLSMVVFLSSCSDTPDTLIETSSPETTYKTGGKYSENSYWRYDSSTSTIYLYGTGKSEAYCWDDDQHSKSHWFCQAENICIEEGITEADEHTFSFCDKARTLTLPASYTGILPKINNIEKYVIADNNPKYSSDEYGVLFNNDKTEIILFPKCSPIESYDIPEGVMSIGSGAFDETVNLKTVTVPESLENLSDSTFKKSAVYSNPENWEDGLFYAGDYLVEADRNIKTEHISVKEGTRRIGANAFAHCENIKSVTVPDSVRFIGAQAFESCLSLENVYIGSSVEFIGTAPFAFEVEGTPCINLKNIEVSRDNKNYTSVDGVLFNKEMTELIQYPIGKKQKEYVIPDSVTTLGYGAFCYCDELTRLTVGKGITVIDCCLLFGCDNIETVILPDSLIKLDSGAFKHSGIKYIDIPDSVTYLGCEAMASCHRLETVKIGKGVSYVDSWAIGGSSLKEIIVDSENKHFASDKGVLFNKDKTELLLYPANKSGEIYYIPESVKEIKLGAIGKAKNLKKIYVGSAVGRIEECNFYESVEDDESEYRNETNYDIYFDGTEKQWNELFVSEYEKGYIDKTKIHFL